MYKNWSKVLSLLEKIGLIFKLLSISHEIITAPRIAKSLDTIKINNQDGIIPINDRYGGTFTSESSDDWDVIKAVRTNTGYTALVDGTNFYDGGTVVWTINSLGVHTSDNGWISDSDAVSAGYKTVFNTDINNNRKVGI